MTSTIVGVPTGTDSLPTTSTTDSSNSGSASSSPLLFFVALGFGVLFTNLWIIVGVKYCFRYSQRNRRGGQFEEEVDLTTLHPFVGMHHPVQRRRREKKLLKIDEVNERFPAMTYKAWRAQRERAGLSAEGGIANASSPVVRTAIPELEEEREDSAPRPSSSDPLPPTSDSIVSVVSVSNVTNPHESAPDAATGIEIKSEKTPSLTTSTTPSITPDVTPSVPTVTPAGITQDSDAPIPSSSKHRDSTLSSDVDPEDDDDHHLPDGLLNTSGDNCAICIELLEDDDEVRGLTCGHCYHQSCLDPWLTQRRASCPLCKADYYIPRPPAENADTSNENTATARSPHPVTTEHWSPLAPLFLRPFRPVVVPTQQYPYPPPFTRFDRPRTESQEPPTAVGQGHASHSSGPRWFRNPLRMSRNTAQDGRDVEREAGAQPLPLDPSVANSGR